MVCETSNNRVMVNGLTNKNDGEMLIEELDVARDSQSCGVPTRRSDQ